MLNESILGLVPSYDIVINEALGDRSFVGRMSESEIFQYANTATTYGEKKEKLVDVLPKMLYDDKGFIHVEYEDLDPTVIYEIFESSKFKTPNRESIVSDIKNGHIVMVYSSIYKIPTSIPFVIKNTSPLTIYVNVSDFVEMDQYGKVKISQFRNYAGFYSAIYTAFLTRIFAQNDITPARDVIKCMTDLYGSMFSATVTRLCHADSMLKNKLKYIGAKFALIQMYGTLKGTSIFYNNISVDFEKSMGRVMCENIEASISQDSYDSISLLIAEMQRVYPSMKKLTKASFIESWMSMYGSFAALTIDYTCLMLYVLICLYRESPLVNRSMLEKYISPRSVNAAMNYLESIHKG